LDFIEQENKIINDKVDKLSRKSIGSASGSKLLECFNAVHSHIGEEEMTELKASANFAAIRAIVENQTKQISELYNDRKVAETTYVQPNTVALLESLTKLLEVEGKHTLEVKVKAKEGAQFISYSTSVFDGSGNIVKDVRGETDEAVLYDNVVICFFEDKALNVSIETSAAKSQAFVELKAFAEKFIKATTYNPDSFWGVLRNGRSWMFLLRVIRNCSVGFSYYGPFELFGNDINADVNKDSLDNVAAFLCVCITNMKYLMSLVQNSEKSVSNSIVKVGKGGGNDDKDMEDENDDDVDGDYDYNLSSRVPKKNKKNNSNNKSSSSNNNQNSNNNSNSKKKTACSNMDAEPIYGGAYLSTEALYYHEKRENFLHNGEMWSVY